MNIYTQNQAADLCLKATNYNKIIDQRTLLSVDYSQCYAKVEEGTLNVSVHPLEIEAEKVFNSKIECEIFIIKLIEGIESVKYTPTDFQNKKKLKYFLKKLDNTLDNVTDNCLYFIYKFNNGMIKCEAKPLTSN